MNVVCVQIFYFVQHRDARENLGLYVIQKYTATLKMLSLNIVVWSEQLPLIAWNVFVKMIHKIFEQKFLAIIIHGQLGEVVSN